MERERPALDPVGPVGSLGIQILSPMSDQTVIVPGALPVRIEVTGAAGLLDSVNVTAIRFATLTPVSDTAVAFDPPAGDTTFTLVLALGAFPTNTQLNLLARAQAQGRSATSAEVPVRVIDCSGGEFEFCP